MSLRLKIRGLFRRQLQRDLDDELASHLDAKAEELEAEGWAPEEARREARRRFGNVARTMEDTRDLHVFTWMESLIQDTRYGLRRLWREPTFTLSAVLTLGIIIGANGAVFSLMENVVLRPVPFARPEQLVLLRGQSQASKDTPISVPEFEDYARAKTLASLAATETQSVNLTGVAQPTRVIGGFVSADFFPMLGVQAAMGRLLLPGDDQAGAARVCVVGHGVWKDQFGGDPDLVGRTLILNNEPYTVVGILPRDFEPRFTNAGVWIPFRYYPNYGRERGRLNVDAMGRLRDGVRIEQARAEIATIARRLAAQYPEANAGRSVSVARLEDEMTASVRQVVLALAGAVLCVLLAGCSNIAGLLLTKAVARRQEMAIRVSLGAGRGRLTRQLLTESILLAAAGCALGTMLAAQAMALMNAFWGDLMRGAVLKLDGAVMGYLAGVSLLTGVLFGLAPALFARKQTAAHLRQRGAGLSQGRLRDVLVTVQVALALVLLIGAGLMLKSVARLSGVDPGFRGERVLTMEYRMPRNRYTNGEQQTQFHKAILARVAALPGVQSAALVGGLPFSGNSNAGDAVLADRPEPPRDSPWRVSVNQATPGYFATVGIPLLKGRDFLPSDTADSMPAAIVSRVFVRRFWPDGNAIGQIVTVSGQRGVIVGVVGDVKENALEDTEIPQIYFAYAQRPSIFATLAVRTSGDPLAMTRPVQKAIWSLDADQPMWKIRTLGFLVDRSFSYRRYITILLGGFSIVALALAAIGLYGVIAYSVSQRTAEFGLRAAIGATPGDIARLVMGRSAALVGTGLACGLGAALVLTRYLRTQVYQVSTADPAVYGGLSLALLCVALAAVMMPVRRAMRIDPAEALRQE